MPWTLTSGLSVFILPNISLLFKLLSFTLSQPAGKMTNYIEKKSDSVNGQRQKLVAAIMQIQQSIATNYIEVEECRLCPRTRLALHVQSEEEIENEKAENYVDIGDEDILIENSYDSNSDGDNISVFYDSDGDDDARSYFPCPFCYVEIEVPVLCSHLQEEHCFDLKNAVCPLCAANLGKDATGHFIVQHSSSLKRRRKSEKFNSSSGNSAMLGKRLVTNAKGNRHDPTPDPLASIQNPDSDHQDGLSGNNVSNVSDGNGADDDKYQQERKEKAEFVQQLAASTIFEEIWW